LTDKGGDYNHVPEKIEYKEADYLRHPEKLPAKRVVIIVLQGDGWLKRFCNEKIKG
jgi:hypothetical protein